MQQFQKQSEVEKMESGSSSGNIDNGGRRKDRKIALKSMPNSVFYNKNLILRHMSY